MFLDDKRVRIKICGITRLEDARFASGALVDYLGFIFWPESKRYITPAEAGAIISWLEGPECVGVFVDQPIDDVNDFGHISGIQYVQLHGEESPDYCKLLEHKIIKAFRVAPEMTADHLRYMIDPYTNVVDHFLFDTFKKGLPGGTGETFDWDILHQVAEEFPIFLSGGLHAGNVTDALKHIHPWAVDASSKLESEPGIKDFQLMDEFIEAVRHYNDTFEL
jgi:phosphoribosylanthranilate isomerase